MKQDFLQCSLLINDYYIDNDKDKDYTNSFKENNYDYRKISLGSNGKLSLI